MRPSHLVIDGGEPPLLKITVWLGNKAADKYRLAPLFGRADVGKIPHGHRWDLPSPPSAATPLSDRESPLQASFPRNLGLCFAPSFDPFAEILRASPESHRFLAKVPAPRRRDTPLPAFRKMRVQASGNLFPAYQKRGEPDEPAASVKCDFSGIFHNNISMEHSAKLVLFDELIGLTHRR